MRLLRNIPINRKLVVIIVLTSGLALLLSGVAIVVSDAVLYRASIRRDLDALAQIVADNSTAALSFQNAQDAEVTLASLRARSSLVQACIYTTEAKVFASYGRPGTPPECPQTVEADSQRITGDRLFLFRSILLNDKKVGTLYFQYDLAAIAERQKLFSGLVAAIALASMLLAVILSTRLRRLISQPITHLAGTTRAVSETKDYSIRAVKQTDDELGLLVDSFNEMLTNLQQSDAELRQAHDELEQRVEKRTEELRVANDERNRFFTLSLDLFCVASFDGYFKRLNPGWEKVLGWTLEELLSKPFMDLIHPDDLEASIREIENQQKGKTVQSFRNRFLCKDGSYRWLSWKSIPVIEEALMYATARDVTESMRTEAGIRKLNEELGRRSAELEVINKELESFTHSVAHDLRAPLRHINAFSRILAEEARPHLPPQANQYLDRIFQAAQQMGELIDDLLNLSRVGRKELSLQMTGLNSLVDEVVVNLRPEMEGREIEWKIDKLPFVEADPALLKVVFTNLLSNAVKYTRPRDHAVIEVGRLNSNGESSIFVRDNGVGFSMKYSEKLFGIFQRLHRQEDFEGTGIGLATVQRIIHKHGGRIWAEAEVDKGACFYFTVGTGERAS